jgi:ribosomal protein L7/L12
MTDSVLGNRPTGDQSAEVVARLENELITAARILAGAGEVIHGIKAYRAATGASLKESKDWVDRFRKPTAPTANEMFEARMTKLERSLAAISKALSN